MNETSKNCHHQEHSNIEAVFYCVECKIYMCNKCENFHSKLCNHHHKYTLDKNKKISEIFTGYCKEENHLDKLEFFCKTHNQLCCSGCITKIKLKDKGKHSDCELSSLEDIKENKFNLLKENILNLEKLSKEMNELINEIKIVFETINKNKEDLKLDIQKIFTKIRNSVNEREDEILSKVDELFDNVYMKETEMEEIDKYPNKIKSLLKQGKDTIDNWEKENNNKQNELSSLVNNCINIEKTLFNINNVEQNIRKCKTEMASVIKFSPFEEKELNTFISNIITFGKVYKENKDLNINKYNNIQPKKAENNFYMEITCTKEEQKYLKLEFLSFLNGDYNIYYPNSFIYKEDEIILTFHLDSKTEFINYIDMNKEFLEKIFKALNLSIRRNEKKLFLDLKAKSKEILYLYEFILNFIKISVSFKTNLTFENFGKIHLEELIKLLTSFYFSIKGEFSDLDNSLKEFNQKKININEQEKKFIENVLNFLIIHGNSSFKLNISQDKLSNFFKENLGQKLEHFIQTIISFLENVVIISLKTYGFKTIYEDIDFNKILVTLLFAKFKSGFILELNTKGISDFLKKKME